MKKEYFANLDYNRAKRRKTLTLGIILFILASGAASLFIIKRDILFICLSLGVLIIPCMSIPSAFKNYPLTVNPLVVIDNNSVTTNKQQLTVKEIVKIKVTIDIPSSNFETISPVVIEKFRSSKPKNEYFGAFDVVIKNEKGKNVVLYSHIDNVIDALENALKIGVKNYDVYYVIKRNTVTSEYDLISDVRQQKQEEFANASKKSKTRQLI